MKMPFTKDIHSHYKQRINRVLDYVESNLEEKLDLKSLAAIGNFSLYHFHRIIKAYLGEPLMSYIKRLRLEKSAQLLTFSNIPVNEVASKVGYDTASSFSSAFSSFFGQSPFQYRQAMSKIDDTKNQTFLNKVNFNLEPEIKQLSAMRLVFVRVYGEDYAQMPIDKAWKELFDFAGSRALINAQTLFVGIPLDDPEVSSNCQYQACIAIDEKIKGEGSVGVKEIPAGEFAVFTFKGSETQLDSVYHLIFKEWLLKSDYELRDENMFDLYVNSSMNSKSKDRITQIHLPVHKI